MSEEFCDGVKILLNRMESNPEEFKTGNKWSHVLPKEAGGYSDWTHALSIGEQQALSEGIRKIAKTVFTEAVMTTILEDKEPLSLRFKTTERYSKSWIDPSLFQNIHTGGTGGGGSAASTFTVQQTVQKAKELGLFHILKDKFTKL